MTQILYDASSVPATPEPHTYYTRERTILLSDNQAKTVILSMSDVFLAGEENKHFGPSLKVTTITHDKNEATHYNLSVARQVIAEYDAWQAELAAAAEK